MCQIFDQRFKERRAWSVERESWPVLAPALGARRAGAELCDSNSASPTIPDFAVLRRLFIVTRTFWLVLVPAGLVVNSLQIPANMLLVHASPSVTIPAT